MRRKERNREIEIEGKRAWKGKTRKRERNMYTQVSRKTQLYTDIDRYINKNMKSHRAEVKYKKIEREKEREK